MKFINHIPLPQSPLFTLPPLTSTPPHSVPTFQFCLLLLISKLIFKGFLSVSPLWVYFTLVCSTPSITLPYPLTSHSRLFQQLSIPLLIYSTFTDVMFMILLILYHSLFFFLLPLVHWVVPLLQHVLQMSLYMIMFVFVYMFFFGSIFHIGEKTCVLCLSEPALLHLTWCPLITSIYLQTTCCDFHFSLCHSIHSSEMMYTYLLCHSITDILKILYGLSLHIYSLSFLTF
jgi:hypothetical protein